MPDFEFLAVDGRGQQTGGRLTAPDRHHALQSLRRRGLTPIDLTAADGTAPPPASSVTASAVSPGAGRRAFLRSRAIRTDDLHAFIQELTALLRAGLPLDRSLRVLADMQPHPALRDLQRTLLKDIKSGRSLSQAMAAHAPPFGPLYINMVRAGEVSGKLPEALGYLLEHLERSKALRSTLVSALIYPAILLLSAILSIALMLGFVVPQFKPLFEDLGDRLPVLTAAVVWLGDMLVEVGPQLLIAVLLLALALDRWWRTPAGRLQRERLTLSIPLLGPLILRYQLARFIRTLGTLLINGVGLVPSLTIAKDGLTYDSLRNRLHPVPTAIKQGQRFTRAMADVQLLDPAELQLVALGEETGRLDAMLLELAQRQEHSVELQTRRLLTLLEPLLILGLGVVIALIIIAILLGILSVNELVA